jgi:hypothetical protein
MGSEVALSFTFLKPSILVSGKEPYQIFSERYG